MMAGILTRGVRLSTDSGKDFWLAQRSGRGQETPTARRSEPLAKVFPTPPHYHRSPGEPSTGISSEGRWGGKVFSTSVAFPAQTRHYSAMEPFTVRTRPKLRQRFSRRLRRPRGNRETAFALMWIAGGIFGLWVGAMFCRQYLGIDVLTPIEAEIRRFMRGVIR